MTTINLNHEIVESLSKQIVDELYSSGYLSGFGESCEDWIKKIIKSIIEKQLLGDNILKEKRS